MERVFQSAIPRSAIWKVAVLLLAVTGLTAGAWAQDYPQGPNGESAPQSDGPAPDVARISLIHGDVSTQRGDTGNWGATSINAPLLRGDQVATGEKSRVEIQLDYANLLRLAAHSQVKIADLSGKRIQVQVAQGYANYTMLKGSEAEVEIDTPNVAVHPLRQGRYRVQVNSDSETDVIVREGEAEITTPQGSTQVREGEMIAIRGTTEPEYKVSSAPPKDDWDGWNSDRDNVIRQSASWSHTNRYYTGANDLDGYGRWIYVPGYGNVWQPYQQAAWAPYQTGRWVYEPYYGWTWVSYEPWGWAPYHYGRWFYYGNNWCWWPGPVYVGYRPLWSPAFVFFVGFGHRSGFGFGSIGWFPVGPGDPFYPWYGRGFSRVNVVNITNIRVVNRGGGFIGPLAVRGRQPFFSNANLALTNPRIRGSITSVSAENFGRGGNEGWRHGVEEHELRASSVMTGNVPVVPTRESLHAGRGNAAVPTTIQTHNNEHFFTRHQPPAGPESFHDQAARVQRVVGPEAAGAQGNVHSGQGQADRREAGGAANGSMNGRGSGNEKAGTANVSPGGATTGGAQSHVDSGNSRLGRSEGGNTAEVHNGGAQSDHGGWSKFGSPGGHTSAAGQSGRTESGSSTPRSSDRQMEGRGASSIDRSSVQSTGQNSPVHIQEDRGGWQKFPSNSDHGSSDRGSSDRGSTTNNSSANRNDRVDTNGSGGKPPLDLHRPIVTPRQPDTRNNNDQRNSAPPSRTPDVHSQPRYSPPPQRNESRGGYEPRGSSGSSHGSGNGDHGSSHESHSSSSPKHR
ncbi:MAG TPA: DUF6600 domain-containing protein [Candidatus Angelobacter sp.]